MSDMDEGDSPYVGLYCAKCACKVTRGTTKNLDYEDCPECGAALKAPGPFDEESASCVLRYPYDSNEKTTPQPHGYVKPPCVYMVYYKLQGSDELMECGLFTEKERDACVGRLRDRGAERVVPGTGAHVNVPVHSVFWLELSKAEILERQKKSKQVFVETGIGVGNLKGITKLELRSEPSPDEPVPTFEQLRDVKFDLRPLLERSTSVVAGALATGWLEQMARPGFAVSMRTAPTRGLPLCTFTGKAFFVLDPRAEDICIEDIAHHLSHLCRFAGATREMYSVAEHCVRGTLELARRGHDDCTQLAFLLHDAAEAYCIDLPRPLKRALPEYERIENGVQRFVHIKFIFTGQFHGEWTPVVKAVKDMDDVMLSTERRDLMHSATMEWGGLPEPLPERIVPWSSRAAKIAYLGLFHKLTNGKFKEEQ